MIFHRFVYCIKFEFFWLPVRKHYDAIKLLSWKLWYNHDFNMRIVMSWEICFFKRRKFQWRISSLSPWIFNGFPSPLKWSSQVKEFLKTSPFNSIPSKTAINSSNKKFIQLQFIQPITWLNTIFTFWKNFEITETPISS